MLLRKPEFLPHPHLPGLIRIIQVFLTLDTHQHAEAEKKFPKKIRKLKFF
jgi:hypothetical protein